MLNFSEYYFEKQFVWLLEFLQDWYQEKGVIGEQANFMIDFDFILDFLEFFIDILAVFI